MPLVVVAGPTGSGKSALAIELAVRFQGEIVNSDSLQLYRGFDIGTAKTPIAERRGIPHHLFDVLEPREGYSAGEFARAARAILREISNRGRLPILVGGTGFYVSALLEGLPALPERDAALRVRLAAKEVRAPGKLHRLLARLDPEAASRIHANDVQKLTRALEIRLTTGASLPPRTTADPLVGYAALKIGLNPDRRFLYERLDRRARLMFQGTMFHGASGGEGPSTIVDEVQKLLEKGATGEEKPFEALGYRQALLYVRGKLPLEQAIELTQAQTRQYAKRQLTWFRRDPEMRWLPGFGDELTTQADAAELVRAAAG